MMDANYTSDAITWLVIWTVSGLAVRNWLAGRRPPRSKPLTRPQRHHENGRTR